MYQIYNNYLNYIKTGVYYDNKLIGRYLLDFIRMFDNYDSTLDDAMFIEDFIEDYLDTIKNENINKKKIIIKSFIDSLFSLAWLYLSKTNALSVSDLL